MFAETAAARLSTCKMSTVVSDAGTEPHAWETGRIDSNTYDAQNYSIENAAYRAKWDEFNHAASYHFGLTLVVRSKLLLNDPMI